MAFLSDRLPHSFLFCFSIISGVKVMSALCLGSIINKNLDFLEKKIKQKAHIEIANLTDSLDFSKDIGVAVLPVGTKIFEFVHLKSVCPPLKCILRKAHRYESTCGITFHSD